MWLWVMLTSALTTSATSGPVSASVTGFPPEWPGLPTALKRDLSSSIINPRTLSPDRNRVFTSLSTPAQSHRGHYFVRAKPTAWLAQEWTGMYLASLQYRQQLSWNWACSLHAGAAQYFPTSMTLAPIMRLLRCPISCPKRERSSLLEALSKGLAVSLFSGSPPRTCPSSG